MGTTTMTSMAPTPTAPTPSVSSSSSSSSTDVSDPNAILAHYRRLQGEATTLSTKLGELEQEINEHTIVLEKIKPLDPNRTGYRLIGGVLVEKPLKEIVPAVEQNEVGIRAVVKQLGQRLEAKEAETRAWKEKYNIRLQTEKEVRDSQEKAEKLKESSSSGGGSSLLG